jgi:hypothetical protein
VKIQSVSESISAVGENSITGVQLANYIACSNSLEKYKIG